MSDIPDLEILLREMEEEMALLRQQREAIEAAEIPEPSSSGLLNRALLIIGVAIILYAVWANRKKIKFPPLPILVEKAYLKLGLQPPSMIRQWASLAALPPLHKAYQEINKALTRLGRKPSHTQTPSERAAMLSELIPGAGKPARELVHEYEADVFGRQHSNLIIALRSAGDIRRFSNSAFLKGLINQLPIAAKILRNSKHDVKSQV